MEVYILFVHISLRAAVYVAGEQNPQTKAHEMERDVLTDYNGVFFFSLLGCGIHGTAGTVTLTRYDTILMMLTWSGPSGTIAIRCRQFIIVSQAQSRCAVCCHVTVSLLLQVMTPGLYYYYSTELAFYWSLVFSQFTDIKRKVRGTGVVSALRQQLERL